MINQRISITKTLDCIIYNPNSKEERVCFLDHSIPNMVRIARMFTLEEWEKLSSDVIIDSLIKEQHSNLLYDN